MRPSCARESLTQLRNIIDDIFNDSRQGAVSLSRLAHELGEKIQKPPDARKSIVLLLGNGAGPQVRTVLALLVQKCKC